MRTTLYTVGHSNRPLSALLSLLQEAAIACLVDVRAMPSSTGALARQKAGSSTTAELRIRCSDACVQRQAGV